MSKRLTEKHPITQKFRKFEDFMIKNKISIEWDSYRMVFMDNITGETAYVRDSETSEECNDLPWMCGTKLVQED